MSLDRLVSGMHRPTDQTVFAELLAPMERVGGALVAMLLAQTLGRDGLTDTKALRRQGRREAKRPDQPDGTDRPARTLPLFCHTTKVSRQVMRFFKHCFLKPASPALYERELRPLLMAYR